MIKLTKDLTPEELQEYRELAKFRYENHIKRHDTAQILFQEYGKWLLSSLLLTNGGAILGIAGLEKAGVEVFLISGLFFIFGLVFAFLSGLYALLNTDHHRIHANEFVRPNMLYGPDWDIELNADEKSKKILDGMVANISSTYKSCLRYGIVSAAFLIAGALAIWISLAFNLDWNCIRSFVIN